MYRVLSLSTCPDRICGAGVSPASGSRDDRTTKHGVVSGQVLSGLIFATLLLVGVQENRADDFRIENRVYVAGEIEPLSRSLTLFQQGVVYDLMAEPAEVTIFDQATGNYTLLNMTQQEQTELTKAEIEAFNEKLRQLAAKQKEPLANFFAEPKFEERFDAAGQELSLTSPWVSYRVTTTPAKNPAITAQYREFSDAYARLNAMLNPGSRPPLARMKVNEALARRQLLAREVNLTLTSARNNALQKTSLRSEHDFAPSLTSADLDQIQNVQKARSTFKSVPYDKYRKNRVSAR